MKFNTSMLTMKKAIKNKKLNFATTIYHYIYDKNRKFVGGDSWRENTKAISFKEAKNVFKKYIDRRLSNKKRLSLIYDLTDKYQHTLFFRNVWQTKY